MIHYLYRPGRSSKIHTINDTASAGHASDCEKIVFSLKSETSEFSFNAINLFSATDNSLISPLTISKKSQIEFSLKDVSDFDNRFILKVVADCSDGVKRIICSIALTKLSYVPEVVFVVGSPRSGTTAVGNAIQQAFEVNSHGESHISDLVSKLIDESHNHFNNSKAAKNKGTLTQATQDAHMEALLCESIRGLHQDFYGKKVIIDKTPGNSMINALPSLFRVYPQAKVVFCKRRGIENVASRLKKFPKVGFEAHCKQWRNAFNAWVDAKKEIVEQTKTRSWFVDAEQFKLITDLEKEVEKIAEVLKLEKQQAARAIDYLQNNSPQKTTNSNDAKSFDDLSWTDSQKATFKKVCGPQMKRQKYSYDANYFAK